MGGAYKNTGGRMVLWQSADNLIILKNHDLKERIRLEPDKLKNHYYVNQCLCKLEGKLPHF